jgi:hypothetical protein
MVVRYHQVGNNNTTILLMLFLNIRLENSKRWLEFIPEAVSGPICISLEQGGENAYLEKDWNN